MTTAKGIGWRTVAGAALGLALAQVAAAATPDRPEPGKQGETLPGEAHILAKPYSKGVEVVGHNPLGGRSGNLIMAWADRCAYVAGPMPLTNTGPAPDQAITPTSGLAVLDVRDAQHPVVTGYLQDKGALHAYETTNAVVAPGRAVLAASTYGGVPGTNGPKEGWLDVYDVSDCAHPRLMSEVRWPEPVHTLTVAPNGRRVYGTVINPFTGDGGIEVMDISDLTKPRFVAKFGVTRPDGSTYAFAPHEISLSPDERRIYAGTIASKGGDLNKGVNLLPPNAVGLGPEAGGIYVLDNTDLVQGRPNPKMRLVGTALHGGWHSAIQARIAGRPYLVGAGELGACPGAWPRISSIADPAHPVIVGQFRLQMNMKQNCPPPGPAETASKGVVGGPGTAASHFNDVDSATDTRLGLFPFMYAGLRIVDLRNPAAPKEVAYFKPGDACMSHVRYVKPTGQIWFACQDSGFWVIKLKPDLRAALKLNGPA